MGGAQNKVLLQIPKNGPGFASFIPKGYDTILTTKGDLNKDSVDDLVLVLKSRMEPETGVESDPDSIPPRLLIVLLKTNSGFQLAGKSDQAILCKACGGVFGDPLDGVSVEKGLLIIYHYGGSAWRWSDTRKFRYQKDGFYLIGQTTYSYWNVDLCESLDEFSGTNYKDVNLVTGAYEEKKVSEEGCRLIVNKKGKQPVKPLVKLEKFKIDN